MHILLIEDDTVVAQSLELMLRTESFQVQTSAYGEEGVQIASRGQHDLIVLDLNLPDISGYDVLRGLRAIRNTTPVLILSGLGDIESKVRGFGFGADDYLMKPFHKDELVARIHAVLRRSRPVEEQVIRCGDLVINEARQMAEVAGTQIPLTTREYQLLTLLGRRQGATLTKEMVISQMYGGMDEPKQKIIDVYVCKLRKKIVTACGKDYIETIWGRGFRLRDPSGSRDHAAA
jgi:two-component system, cell cycle response regulator CtrA